jgi:putative tricarboxylic transport membrane protein
MEQLDAHPETPPDTSGRTGRLARRAQVPLGQLGLAALGFYVTIEAHSLGLWTDLGPGPGLLPLLLGIALLGLTAAWVVQTIVGRRRGADEGDGPHAGERLDGTYVVGIIGGLILLAALMDLLGFQISMALFLFVELLWLGRQRWWLSAVVALVASIGTFVVFDRVLGVALPLSSLPVLSGMGL